MKRRYVIFITLLSLSLLIPLSSALAGGPLRVEVAVMATDVKSLEPAGVAQSFPSDVGRVYCFTRIAGAEAPTVIKHVWYRENVRMAEITLEVGSRDFRTYSYKTILPEWTGRWRVDVTSEGGETIETLYFTVE